MQKDLKEAYSVQTPHTAVSLFNVLMMQRSAAELHRMLLDTAREAAANIQTNIERKTAEYQRFEAFMPINPAVSVLTFEKLWNKAQEKAGKPEAERILNFAFANRGSLETATFQRKSSLNWLHSAKKMLR